MADSADEAQGISDFNLALQLSKVNAREGGLDHERCENCDDEIPEARRKAVPGCELCSFCQTLKERRAQLYAG
ncbi:TraR/DksA C4-type zinc finger protein [Pokkaliibacter sp. CJK22405]|uniref:TraR/DksA C4-type zinc finger protein n=1 Tax=Pokkaliibacter sp. CJK22405 TaxID=3384615 RepID=UPI003984AB9C